MPPGDLLSCPGNLIGPPGQLLAPPRALPKCTRALRTPLLGPLWPPRGAISCTGGPIKLLGQLNTSPGATYYAPTASLERSRARFRSATATWSAAQSDSVVGKIQSTPSGTGQSPFSRIAAFGEVLAVSRPAACIPDHGHHTHAAPRALSLDYFARVPAESSRATTREIPRAAPQITKNQRQSAEVLRAGVNGASQMHACI